MKKISFAIFLVVILMFAVAPACALTYLGTIDSLPNYNWDTEERWLEGLPGLANNSTSINFIGKYDFPELSHYQSLNQFDPEFSWTYVVIKYGKNLNAYRSDGELYLTVGPLAKDISHVTFFGNGAQVPEPGTMLLLGLGLLGLGITTRRKS